MKPDSTSSAPSITRGHANLLLAATLLTTLLVALGGIVCATESAAGCPDWPGCYGRIVPPPQINAIIEYTHRFVAALTTPVIIAAAVVSWRRTRALRWVTRPILTSIAFVLAVVVFGAFAVLTGLSRIPAALDLSCALIALGLVVTSTTVAISRRAGPALADRLSLGAQAPRVNLWAVGGVFAVYVSGILVAGKGSLTRCIGWPMWQILPDDVPGWPQGVRLALSGIAALLVLAAIGRAWQAGQRTAAGATGVAFLIEMAATLWMMTAGTAPWLLVIHVAAAAALWSLLVVLAVRASLSPLPETRPARQKLARSTS